MTVLSVPFEKPMLKVLLVNDTPRHLGRLRDALTAAGCLVVGEADNAFILADQVAQLAPDVIIVDTESPSRDTLEQVCVLSQSATRTAFACWARTRSGRVVSPRCSR